MLFIVDATKWQHHILKHTQSQSQVNIFEGVFGVFGLLFAFEKDICLNVFVSSSVRSNIISVAFSVKSERVC